MGSWDVKNRIFMVEELFVKNVPSNQKKGSVDLYLI